MADRLDIVKDVASQRVWFRPQEGRPSTTPTVTIKDRNGATITAAATTNVVQETTSTTVATENTVGDRSIKLTSVSGIEWRGTYLMTNSLLQREWVRVRSVASSTSIVEFDERLEFVHDTAATFVGVGFYRTLQTAEVDTLEELYRARASYVVDSVTYTREVMFDVVLTPLANPLSVVFVKARRAAVMRQQPSETLGDDLLDLRESAWDTVRKGIRDHSDGWRPALVRTGSDLEEWGLAQFDLLCHENGIVVASVINTDSIEAKRELESDVINTRRTALASLEFMDLNEDDNQSADETRPLTMDYIR